MNRNNKVEWNAALRRLGELGRAMEAQQRASRRARLFMGLALLLTVLGLLLMGNG